MKTKNTYEVNLYSVFANEKNRVGDEFTVAYNNKKQQLTYKLEGKGSLTAKYGRDIDNENREDFYYSPEGSDKKQPVFVIAGNGTARRFQDEYMYIPEEFRRVVEGYYAEKDRPSIGIDKAQAEAKKHKTISFER